MRSPSLVPGFDLEVCVVLDDLGQIGRVYREVDEESADRESIITDILTGQFNRPARIVAFNTAEGWSRDITEDVAREIASRAQRKGEPLSEGAQEFVEWSTGESLRAWVETG